MGQTLKSYSQKICHSEQIAKARGTIANENNSSFPPPPQSSSVLFLLLLFLAVVSLLLLLSVLFLAVVSLLLVEAALVDVLQGVCALQRQVGHADAGQGVLLGIHPGLQAGVVLPLPLGVLQGRLVDLLHGLGGAGGGRGVVGWVFMRDGEGFS